MFLSPMLAKPLPKDFILEPDTFSAEEKFDGHRLIVEVSGEKVQLFSDKGVVAWSRYGIERKLPHHLLDILEEFPNGIYDGELLVPGKRSYGVTELTNSSDLHYFIFDVLQIDGRDETKSSYEKRRELLKFYAPFKDQVQLAQSTPVNTWEEIISLRNSVWARDGEGLILKRINAPYQIGKRSKDFIKIKALRSDVLSIIGFIPSHGEIVNRGLYATVVLRDDEGNVTTVKTRNDAECRKFEEQAYQEDLRWETIRANGKQLKMIINHPAVGRKLHIEFQERTPDGNYRHPRWDRWD